MNIGRSASSRFGATKAEGARKSVLPLLCALAFALVALVALPSTASATFSVSNFTYTNSAQQAAGHPNTSIAFTRNGTESEDLRDVLIDLPTGVFPNPESAISKCTSTQFNADTCPNASKVGSLSANIKAMSLLSLTAPGSIYILTPASNQVATLGMILRPAKICILFIFCAQPQKVFLKTGVVVRTYEDSGIRTYTPGTPRTTSISIPLIVVSINLTADITMNKLTLSFQSRANSSNNGPYFWFNSSSCVPAPAKITITSYQNVNSSSSVNNSPTGCTSVPFNPTTAVTPSTLVAGKAGPLNYNVSIPDADATIQNALPKLVDVNFPVGSGLDLNALTGVTACTEAQLQSMTCPNSSIIGTATALTKFLPPGLTGNVYAMGIGNQIPIGVQLIGPRQTVVIFRGTLGTRGDANAGTGRVYSLFDRIPQLPFNSFTLTIAKDLYKNPFTCVPATTTSTLTGFNGTTASNGLGTVKTTTNTYTPTDCLPAPETTIDNGPPAITTNRQPAFVFSSNIAGSTFQCKIDTDPYQACDSPFTPALPLGDGDHTFSVLASNGLTPDPTPATYPFNVQTGSSYTINASVTPSTTQAAANPNLSSTVNIAGGQPKSVAIKMPAGLNASLSARPLCANADAVAGTCPAASKIGTLQITADKFGPSTTVGTGDVFLTEAVSGADAGAIAVNVNLPGVGAFIAQGGANLVNNGNNQNLEIRDFPTIINGTDITITQLVLALDGSTNRFLTNPSNCLANDGFVVTSTAFDDSQAAPVDIAFQATGCGSVPFSPSVVQSFTNPVAGAESGVTAFVTSNLGDSTIKTLRVTEPPSLGPNFPSFGTPSDQCGPQAAPNPNSIFDETSCPGQSLVGTMTIDTPLLPFPLVGDVFLINKSPLPWFGVRIDSPGISLRLTGVTSTPQVDPACNPQNTPQGFCQTQISAVFNNLPDVPLSDVTFDLNSSARQGVNNVLSGKILLFAAHGSDTCATGPAKSTVTPFANPNSPVNLTQSIAISGC